jgi:pimeloyl-ACP methyl ester carboxylesterase
MPTFVWVPLVVVASLGLLFFAAWVSGRWFFVERQPDEIHFARTDDGYRIGVTRYRPTEPRGLDPVVLLGPPAANRLLLDLVDEFSLARHLAERGFDTGLVEWRGRGLSTRPRLFSKVGYDWSFDEYVEKDLPAALAAVARGTGREGCHLVGYSFGGMVVYAHLGDPARAERVRSAVTLGAPATFKFQSKYLFSWPLRNLRWLRHRFFMRLLAPLFGWRYLPAVRLLHEPGRISGELFRRFMVNATSNFGSNELLQLGDWLENDAFRSIDHRRDYREGMKAITVPFLAVAGNKDRLAPPPSVKDAHDLVGSTDKKFVIARTPYGHLDLLLAHDAPREVYPLVSDWLAKVEGETRN